MKKNCHLVNPSLLLSVNTHHQGAVWDLWHTGSWNTRVVRLGHIISDERRFIECFWFLVIRHPHLGDQAGDRVQVAHYTKDRPSWSTANQRFFCSFADVRGGSFFSCITWIQKRLSVQCKDCPVNSLQPTSMDSQQDFYPCLLHTPISRYLAFVRLWTSSTRSSQETVSSNMSTCLEQSDFRTNSNFFSFFFSFRCRYTIKVCELLKLYLVHLRNILCENELVCQNDQKGWRKVGKSTLEGFSFVVFSQLLADILSLFWEEERKKQWVRGKSWKSAWDEKWNGGAKKKMIKTESVGIFYFIRELSVGPLVESCLSQPKYVWLYTKYLYS